MVDLVSATSTFTTLIGLYLLSWDGGDTLVHVPSRLSFILLTTPIVLDPLVFVGLFSGEPSELPF